MVVDLLVKSFCILLTEVRILIMLLLKGQAAKYLAVLTSFEHDFVDEGATGPKKDSMDLAEPAGQGQGSTVWNAKVRQFCNLF